jgi:hypothetical protein
MYKVNWAPFAKEAPCSKDRFEEGPQDVTVLINFVNAFQEE